MTSWFLAKIRLVRCSPVRQIVDYFIVHESVWQITVSLFVWAIVKKLWCNSWTDRLEMEHLGHVWLSFVVLHFSVNTWNDWGLRRHQNVKVIRHVRLLISEVSFSVLGYKVWRNKRIKQNVHLLFSKFALTAIFHKTESSNSGVSLLLLMLTSILVGY